MNLKEMGPKKLKCKARICLRTLEKSKKSQKGLLVRPKINNHLKQLTERKGELGFPSPTETGRPKPLLTGRCLLGAPSVHTYSSGSAGNGQPRGLNWAARVSTASGRCVRLECRAEGRTISKPNQLGSGQCRPQLGAFAGRCFDELMAVVRRSQNSPALEDARQRCLQRHR